MIFGMEGRPLLLPSVFALKKAAIVYYNVLFATMTTLLWLPRHHQIKWYLSIIPWITDIVRKVKHRLHVWRQSGHFIHRSSISIKL